MYKNYYVNVRFYDTLNRMQNKDLRFRARNLVELKNRIHKKYEGRLVFYTLLSIDTKPAKFRIEENI
jgi:hypothetical protein